MKWLLFPFFANSILAFSPISCPVRHLHQSVHSPFTKIHESFPATRSAIKIGTASSLRMGPPGKIDYVTGQIISNQQLARGSFLLRVKVDDRQGTYQPGHVLALAIQDPKNSSGELIHPYTVTRADDSRSTIDIIYRVIPSGKMTPVLATLRNGAKVRLGGKFHVPILEGIHAECDHVVAVSTGVGVGPILGFVEQAVKERAETLSVRVFAGFRGLEDVFGEQECEEAGVEFRPCITELSDERYPLPLGFEGLRGRVTHAAPGLLDPDELPTTHFHLVGNGAMVNTFRRGLALAGVPPEHVTVETYFNHRVEADEEEAVEIARHLRAPARPVEPWAGAPS